MNIEYPLTWFDVLALRKMELNFIFTIRDIQFVGGKILEIGIIQGCVFGIINDQILIEFTFYTIDVSIASLLIRLICFPYKFSVICKLGISANIDPQRLEWDRGIL